MKTIAVIDETGEAHVFSTQLAALQWTDIQPYAGPQTETDKGLARKLLEGQSAAIYYRGARITTRITEHK